jgi:hypothetical protein
LYQGGHYESIGLQERCRNLEDAYKKVNKKVEDRRSQLTICEEFHQLVEEVSTSVVGPKSLCSSIVSVTATVTCMRSLRKRFLVCNHSKENPKTKT